MKYVMLLLCTLFLSGCMAGHYEVDEKAMKYTNLNFIGVPTTLGLGITGSSTPITKDLSLTNKHIAYPLLKTITSEHNDCDVAVIKQSNKTTDIHNLGYTHKGMKVKLYGYSGLTMLPVSSSGTVGELINYKGCEIFEVEGAGGVSGMSGGAVVNEKDEVVGIVMGVNLYTWKVLIIPVGSFREILPTDVLDGLKKRNPHKF